MSNDSITAIFETKDYTITIGVSPFVGKAEGQPQVPAAYIISNKNNGLVEGEHRVLGMAIRMAKEMQDIMDEEVNSKSEKEEAAGDLPSLDTPPTTPASPTDTGNKPT